MIRNSDFRTVDLTAGPIDYVVEGSGTGGLEGAEGRVDFKDIIGDPVTFVYRGHISLS
jgi:hypothetical protein